MRVIAYSAVREFVEHHSDAEKPLRDWYTKVRRASWATENEIQYKATQQRIEELLKIVGNDTPPTDPNFIELGLISNLVADYEEQHYPVKPLTLVETMELRMYEMGLTRKNLSEMLCLSKSTSATSCLVNASQR